MVTGIVVGGFLVCVVEAVAVVVVEWMIGSAPRQNVRGALLSLVSVTWKFAKFAD